jgi:hypothetical protein
MWKLLSMVVIAVVLGVVAAPAALGAPAEQIVEVIENEPVVIEDFEDPCTGQILHGEGVQNGIIRITDLGEQGQHVRLAVSGEVDFFDAEGNFVGTWSFRTRVGDQLPPEGQGTFRAVDVGPMEYADGTTARFLVVLVHVFEKGDVKKLEIFKTTCAG